MSNIKQKMERNANSLQYCANVILGDRISSQPKTNVSSPAPRYHIEGDPKVIKALEKIAKEECFVETLKTQFSDSLDFHDISAASLLKALHRAYYQGYSAGMQQAYKTIA